MENEESEREMITCAKCGLKMNSATTVNGLFVCEWCKPTPPTAYVHTPLRTSGSLAPECECSQDYTCPKCLAAKPQADAVKSWSGAEICAQYSKKRMPDEFVERSAYERVVRELAECEAKAAQSRAEIMLKAVNHVSAVEARSAKLVSALKRIATGKLIAKPKVECEIAREALAIFEGER